MPPRVPTWPHLNALMLPAVAAPLRLRPPDLSLGVAAIGATPSRLACFQEAEHANVGAAAAVVGGASAVARSAKRRSGKRPAISLAEMTQQLKNKKAEDERKKSEQRARETALALAQQQAELEAVVGRVVGGADRHGEVLIDFGLAAITAGGAAGNASAAFACSDSAKVDAEAPCPGQATGAAEPSAAQVDAAAAFPEPVVCKLIESIELSVDPIVGDIVRVARGISGAGEEPAVVEVLPRRTELLRRHARRKRPQILCANLDLAVLVVSVAPDFHRAMVDRVTVCAHKQGYDLAIVLNKIDLVPEGTPEREEVDARLAEYEALGYRVLRASAITGEGLPELKRLLAGQTSIFIGNSGVGKSHLLNALSDGQIEARVNAISRIKLGTHTTTTTTMHCLPCAGDEPQARLIDSPGARRFAIWDVEPDELCDHFVEFLDFAPRCCFRNCAHLGELGCAVEAAVEQGVISKRRYESYRNIRDNLLNGLEENFDPSGGEKMAGIKEEGVRPRRESLSSRW